MPFHPNMEPRKPITTPEQLVEQYSTCRCGHYRSIHASGPQTPCDGDMLDPGKGWTYCNCEAFIEGEQQ